MPSEQPRRLRAIEAANYLRVSRSTLAKWRMSRIGSAIPPLWVAACLLFSARDRHLADRM
jgi:hypothetical protein